MACGQVPADVTAILLGRRLPGASSNLPGRQDPDTIPKPCLRLRATLASRRPYAVLLPVGFAVPPALPPARCALTAPFHPYRAPPEGGTRRSVLCGTVPGLAPAGCYPAPLVHGARTFLPGNLSVSPERPSGRLTGTGMAAAGFAVKGRRAQPWRWPWPGRASPAALARCYASTDRRCRRRVRDGNGAGKP
jgi:hypothetical protein